MSSMFLMLTSTHPSLHDAYQKTENSMINLKSVSVKLTREQIERILDVLSDGNDLLLRQKMLMARERVISCIPHTTWHKLLSKYERT